MAETRKCSTSLMQSFFRRAATVSVAGVCLIGLGTLAVPNAVAAIQQGQMAATAQSFDVAPVYASVAAIEAVELPRDPYSVTLFSLVQWPVAESTTISSYFGYRSCAGCTSNHQGIDFNPGAGTPIEVIADGVVVEAEFSGALGVHVIVEHVIDGVVYRSTYAHMQNGSMTVAVGQTVARGTVLGAVGDTGLSTGPHLHFGIQDASLEYIDPYDWMLARVNIGHDQ